MKELCGIATPFLRVCRTQCRTNLPKHSIGFTRLYGVRKKADLCVLERVEEMKSEKFADQVISYSKQDAILYALAIGSTVSDDLKHVYEDHPDFSIFPCFPTTFSVNIITSILKSKFESIKELDFRKIVHSEQYFKLYEPLPLTGSLTITTKLTDILDKRKFSQFIFDHHLYEDQKHEKKLGEMQSVMLCFDSNGFGRRGKCGELVSLTRPPKRLPDEVCFDSLSQNQAALFRLCGDRNPLHIDPGFSSSIGYEKPILHGLCLYGFALRHALKTFGDNDSSVFKSMKVQFSKPIYPGEDIATELWKEGSRTIFQMKARDTNSIVLSGGCVEFHT